MFRSRGMSIRPPPCPPMIFMYVYRSTNKYGKIKTRGKWGIRTPTGVLPRNLGVGVRGALDPLRWSTFTWIMPFSPECSNDVSLIVKGLRVPYILFISVFTFETELLSVYYHRWAWVWVYNICVLGKRKEHY